jgi:hypothetical protein
LDEDFKELLAAFDAEGVKYLIVGGYAVSLHAQPRMTKDLDILVEPSPSNASAVFRALHAFGAPVAGLTPADFCEPGSFFRMGAPPVMVDILPEIAGVDFGAAWARRIVSIIDPITRQSASFIGAEDLLGAKLAAGRPQDLADAEALRQANAGRALGTKPEG